MVAPKDRVDVMVYVAGSRAPGGGQARIVTLLQDIKVFAVDTITDMSKEAGEGAKTVRGSTVSLLVTFEQHQKIALAQKMGEIILSPRNPGDTSDVERNVTSLDDVFGGSPEKANRPEDTPDEEGPMTTASPDASGGISKWLTGLMNPTRPPPSA